MAAGGWQTFALKSNGTLWAWGSNFHGQLGDGTGTDAHAPVRIGKLNDWVSVAAGTQHTVAIKSNGTLWTWGYNWVGQLGDGTTTGRSLPGQVGSDHDWASIAAGESHTLAVKSNGTLWAWGLNDDGRLGDGTTDGRLSPVRVGTDSGWASVKAGMYHTVALKTDGSLWAWGQNGRGQLGDETTSEKHSPTRIGMANDWVFIAAGTRHSVGLKADAATVDINSCTAVSSPGVYRLTADITNSSAANCIQITSSNVILHGGGHLIDGLATSGTRGIDVFSSAGRLSNVVIRGLRLTGWNDGIQLRNTDNGTIEGVGATDNQNSGIHLSNSSSNTVLYNTANTNNFFGILLDGGSTGNLIVKNTANNQGQGIQLGQYGSPAGTNTLRGNTITSNNNGIDYYGSDNMTIEDNIIQNNWRIGIYLEGHYNTITRNLVKDNGRSGNTGDAGIYVAYAHNNSIYNNHFDNYQNFKFDPTWSLINAWSVERQAGTNIVGGPYIGGNYWDGRGCGDSNGDYFCDSAYTLATYNVDSYPLKVFSDADKDGVADSGDNCPNVFNPDQADSDGDRDGDACDNCWHMANDNQADTNGNCPAAPYLVDPLCGDVCERSDTDGDGVPDDVARQLPAHPQSGSEGHGRRRSRRCL